MAGGPDGHPPSDPSGLHVRRWRLFDPPWMRGHAITVASMWVAVLTTVAYAAGHPDRVRKMLEEDIPGEGNPWTYLLVMTVGYTIVLLAMCLGRCAHVVADDEGLRLEWFGQAERRVRWAQIRHAQAQFNKHEQLVALLLTDWAGHQWRFSFGMFAPMSTTAKDILATVNHRVRQHAQPGEHPELPAQVVRRPSAAASVASACAAALFGGVLGAVTLAAMWVTGSWVLVGIPGYQNEAYPLQALGLLGVPVGGIAGLILGYVAARNGRCGSRSFGITALIYVGLGLFCLWVLMGKHDEASDPEWPMHLARWVGTLTPLPLWVLMFQKARRAEPRHFGHAP